MSTAHWVIALAAGAWFGLAGGALSPPDTHAEASALGADEAPLPPGTRTASPPLATLPPVGAAGPAVVERIERGAKEAGTAITESWVEVEYTVDPALEERLRELFKELEVELGHVILLDPWTGQVFAYVSTDPEVFPPTRPYPTASLMKMVTAAATLRARPEAAESDCRYLGSPYLLSPSSLVPPPPDAAGTVVDSFRRAMAISNNQCFARLAVHELGEEALLGEMDRLGILEAPALHHPPGEVEPIRDDLDLGFLGSGLAGSTITPLGAARLAALLADGKLVRPYWIANARDADGNPLGVPGRAAPRLVWPPSVAETLRDVMADVTESGTAKRAFRDERGDPLLGSVRVAGKTGTLSGDDPEGRYQWFIGVAPADAPAVAIAAVVVNDPADEASAADMSAVALREVFCTDRTCNAIHARRLYARALARDAERDRSIRAHRLALRRADEIAFAHDVVDLDRAPRPRPGSTLEIPRRLRRTPVDGEIVLLVTLGPEGRVLEARVASSDLPHFEEFVVAEVMEWRFTPPTRDGTPVRATARLPIPIRIE